MTLLSEIREQPEVLQRAMNLNAGPAREAGRLFEDCQYAVIAARGTSDNAGRYAQYVWGARNGYPVSLTTPSVFSIYEKPPRLDGAVVVGISQSGESPDIIAVLDEARSQGRPTIAITNTPGSPLAGRADVVLDLAAGIEGSVAATKTFTAQLACIALISEALDGSTGSLHDLSGQVETSLASEERAAELAVRLAGMEHCAVLGRGYNHATAFELALKLQELTQVVAQPYSTADFLHGPIAVLEPGYPVVGVVASGDAVAEVEEVLDRVRAAEASLITISNLEPEPMTETIGFSSDVEEWLSPVPAIVCGQLFAYHLALAKGLDPESPRGLHKVTRTT
jgi:glutamine---fructose-6-phosphate transaminase (isomerizing)